LLKGVITTPESPKAIGPYSQAIKAKGFIFASGPLPIDPASGQIVEGDAALQAGWFSKT
jgi:2-iminobutanoate/2-iminopropanoate deaminase